MRKLAANGLAIEVISVIRAKPNINLQKWQGLRWPNATNGS